LSHDDLGDRMKEYENCSRFALPQRLPVIVRVDMRAGHTFTRGLSKPYDDDFNACMKHLVTELCSEMSLCRFGFSQSDEASFVTYSTKVGTEPWFGNVLSKVVSLSASVATVAFNSKWHELRPDDTRRYMKAQFDSRAFVLPVHEVVNYFWWRQADATRNSIESLAHAHFSQKSLNGLNSSMLQEKLFSEKGINWNDVATKYKRGFACKKRAVEITTENGVVTRDKWFIDEEVPVFSADRSYVEETLG
jgi:tRNA(His) 5'-end guanylyltransferase